VDVLYESIINKELRFRQPTLIIKPKWIALLDAICSEIPWHLDTLLIPKLTRIINTA
jgi:hypothetical protein